MKTLIRQLCSENRELASLFGTSYTEGCKNFSSFFPERDPNNEIEEYRWILRQCESYRNVDEELTESLFDFLRELKEVRLRSSDFLSCLESLVSSIYQGVKKNNKMFILLREAQKGDSDCASSQTAILSDHIENLMVTILTLQIQKDIAYQGKRIQVDLLKLIQFSLFELVETILERFYSYSLLFSEDSYEYGFPLEKDILEEVLNPIKEEFKGLYSL